MTWPTKTNPFPDYPENSDWGRDDKETDMQLATLERVGKRYQEKLLRQKFPEATEAMIKVLYDANERDRRSDPGPMAEAALALGRALKTVAGLMADREMLADGIDLEQRALQAIRRGLPELVLQTFRDRNPAEWREILRLCDLHPMAQPVLPQIEAPSIEP